MKITKEQLKNIVRETLQEESEYQTFFKKALEKAGKSIPSMSDEEKKAFFNKIEKTWKGRGQKSEGNAFGAAVAKAKKDGDDSFEVDGKEYKTERFGRGHEGPTFGSEEESLDELTKAQEKLPPALKKAIEKKEESVKESTINEISAKKGLEQVVKGNTKEVEGIKVSKEMAQAMLDWFKSSPYGRKYPKAQNARLHVSIGVMLSFGLDRYAKHKGAKEELKYLKSLKESVNEGVEPQIKKIAHFTGTRPEAVEDFVSKHSLNITKLLKYVQKGGLSQRMELVSALAGRDGNTIQKKVIKMFSESINEAASKTYKIPTQRGTLHIEVEHDNAGVFVDVIFNRVDLTTTDIQFPTGEVEVTQRQKRVKLKESVNEGASTEEKRIVMMAIKKIAKYRNVPLHFAVNDVIRAAEELERTIGKLK